MTANQQTASQHGSSLIDDPAFKEALSRSAAKGRLSNDEIRERRAGRRRFVTAGIAGLLVLGGVGLYHSQSDIFAQIGRSAPQTGEYSTQPGEMKEIVTEDGTMIRLNGASRIALTFADDRRHARLITGQAHFDVRRDEDRPFTVRAGQSETRVLGTAFDINLMKSQVVLSVYRGGVRFDSVDANQPVVVTAGWRRRLNGNRISAPESFDSGQRDWDKGWVNTAGITLADLVEVLNRGGGKPIAAPPAELGQSEISGRFRIDDSRQFLSSLGEAYGFRVRETDSTVVLEAR